MTLATITAGDPSASLAVVMLHGRQMCAADLAPFADSLQLPAYFVFPDAPLPCAPRGRTWWPVDAEERMRRLASGPMELSAMDPERRAEARTALGALVDSLAPRRIALVGFSQGGMLAMDYVLHAEIRPAALALLSSTRIAIDDWIPRAYRLSDLPVLVAHGVSDPELAFLAGEKLRDFAIENGAQVTWVPFDGNHELPLVVWRELRRWLRAR
jgi:phospholipase/carboxylesterase